MLSTILVRFVGYSYLSIYLSIYKVCWVLFHHLRVVHLPLRGIWGVPLQPIHLSIYLLRYVGYSFITCAWYAFPFEALEVFTLSLLRVASSKYVRVRKHYNYFIRNNTVRGNFSSILLSFFVVNSQLNGIFTHFPHQVCINH